MRTKQLEPLLGGWVQSQQRRERRPVAPQSHSTSSAERGEDVCLQTICNARRALEQTRKQTLIAQRPNRSRSRQTSWTRLNASTTEVWRLRLQELRLHRARLPGTQAVCSRFLDSIKRKHNRSLATPATRERNGTAGAIQSVKGERNKATF